MTFKNYRTQTRPMPKFSVNLMPTLSSVRLGTYFWKNVLFGWYFILQQNYK